MIPTDISNCIAWYDPQATRTLSTSPVTKAPDLSYTLADASSLCFCTSVPDQSGSGNTLTEISAGNGVGFAPRWSNFRHCFYNTETTKAMVSTIYNEFNKNYTWSFTFETGATLGTDALFGAQDGTGRRMYVDLQSNGSIIFGIGNTAQTVTGLLTTSTYYHLIVSWENTTGTITAYLNGTQITFTNPAYTIPTATCTQPLHFFCRSNNGTPTNYVNNLAVGDIIGYEKVLNATERLQIKRYMDRRWKKSLIFLVIDSGGQSQEQGRTTVEDWPDVPDYGYDTSADAHDARVLQYGRVSGTDDGKIILGVQAFDHWDMSANNDVGPLLNAAKTYLAYLDNPLYGDRIRIVFQPGAKGGSGLINVDGTRDYWVSGDPIYDQFFTRSNALKALLPHYTQPLISWHQGYASASDGVTQSEHAAAQDTLFNTFRGGSINGVTSTTPIEIGTLGSHFIAQGNAQVGINAAISDTPNRLSHIGVTDLSSFTAADALSDGIHLDPPAARRFGILKGATWISLAPQPMSTTYGLLVTG